MALSQKNLFGRISTRLKSFLKKDINWQDIEYFHENWKNRIEYMSEFIGSGTSVMDLGCGKMWLKDYLPDRVKYIPVDYCKRSDETLMADFNKYQFPQVACDIMFISGCLEYINDPEWFLKQVTDHCKQKVILSYCLLETYPDIKKRKEFFWKNNLTADYIKNEFNSTGFQTKRQDIHNNNTIFVFAKC
jgi:hypothetical protein